MCFLLEECFSHSLQDPVIRPLSELDTDSLDEVITELPIWVKRSDYDRVSVFFSQMFSYSCSSDFSIALVALLSMLTLCTGGLVE